MLSFLFTSLIDPIIDSIDWVDYPRHRAEADETLATLRKGTVADLVRYDKLTDQMTILDGPKDIRLNNAKRGVYLAIIELIDAKADSLTD
jgi:hypothetical protein